MEKHFPPKSWLRTRLAPHLRPLWKVTQATWWTEQRLKIIGFLWVVAFVAGLIGFHELSIEQAPSRSWSDLVYQTLQLPFMQSGLPDRQVNGWLNFARFLAPLMTLVTGLQTLALVLGDRLQSLKLHYLCRDHVVICGLGQKGTFLAEQFRRIGERLVLIERNENNASAKRFREEGTIVLVGDASDRAVLRKARVGRAKRIICLTPADEVNAQICTQAWALVDRNRRKPVSCLVHAVSPELCELLRLEMIEKEMTNQFRIEFFNIFQMGAWALLNQYPPFDEKTARAGKTPHVVIVGMGRFGSDVLLRVAKKWRQLNPESGNCIRMTVVDKDAERKAKALSMSYPKLETVCDVTPWTVEIQSPDFQEGLFLSNRNGALDVSYVYVCLNDQSIGVRAALFIQHQLRGAKVPIVVRMSDSRGLSELLAKKKGTESRFRSIRPFNLLENTCDIRLVHGVTNEILAQAIHSNYIDELRASGQDLHDKPAAVPWEDIPEFLKESNRRQADHIGAKLDAVGCSLAPLRDWDADLLCFTTEETEKLARMEHERWQDERRTEGWKPGARDDKRKKHPDMVPWEQLSKQSQEVDKQAVLDLPKLLASIDVQIYRLPASESD